MNANPLSDILTILNKKNTSDLWVTCSYLSCISVFDNTYGNGMCALFPALNFDKVNSLCKLILKANSRDYKVHKLSGSEFLTISSLLLDIKTKDSIPLITNSDFVFQDFIFKIANSQFRFQQTEIERTLGRNYALLVHYAKERETDLRSLLKDGYIDIENTLLEKNQIKPEVFLFLGYLFLAFFKREFIKYNFITDTIKNEILKITDDKSKIDFCYELIRNIIDNIKPITNLFVFRVDREVAPHPILNNSNFISFLNIIAKSTKDLQQIIAKEKAFRIGNISEQVSALERFPVVKLNENEFVIPDIPIYLESFPLVLHFTLQDYFPQPSNNYNNQMGYLQEFYLEDLFKNSLNKLPLIPETTYKIGKDKWEGPDFTIQDKNKRLILIESKSKRFSAKTRVLIEKQDLEYDLERVFKALKKLPQKHNHMYENLIEYSTHQHIFDISKNIPPLFVVLVSGGLEFLPQIINSYIQSNPEHFLNKEFKSPYCIIDIQDFEYAVEVASQTNNLLSDLLENYWLYAESYFTSDTPEFNIYSYQIDYDKCFAVKFFKDMQKKLMGY